MALLCQFISNRYYPATQGNQRTIQVPQPWYSDAWIIVNARDWKWYEVVRNWKARETERLFDLTPAKLRHAYKGLAVSQAHYDPLEKWYQLVQFVKLRERENLKGDALRAETLRSGAHMLRLLCRDLYNEELPHPNEVTGKSMITSYSPNLDARKDTRRYLELVVNRYELNPQPKASLIVEGPSEEKALETIFEEYLGAHPGKYGIEIIVLGGVDVATRMEGGPLSSDHTPVGLSASPSDIHFSLSSTMRGTQGSSKRKRKKRNRFTVGVMLPAPNI